MIQVDDDVQGIARALYEIDTSDQNAHLRLRYSEIGGFWVVYLSPDDEPASEHGGNGHMVFTATELDGRVVTKAQEWNQKRLDPNYSLSDELEEIDRKAEADRDYELEQKTGEQGERLLHAFQKDLGETGNRAFIGGKE